MPQRSPKNFPVLLLGRATMTGCANLQLTHDIALYVSNQKLRHRHNDSNASAA